MTSPAYVMIPSSTPFWAKLEGEGRIDIVTGKEWRGKAERVAPIDLLFLMTCLMIVLAVVALR